MRLTKLELETLIQSIWVEAFAVGKTDDGKKYVVHSTAGVDPMQSARVLGSAHWQDHRQDVQSTIELIWNDEK